MKRNTFGRAEHLKSEKAIGELFETGSSLSVQPIRLIYKVNHNATNSIKVGFAVPKKKFKRAVDRNLLKRRMRESYRLNKYLFVHENDDNVPSLEIMMVYQGQTLEDFIIINESIKSLLKKLIQKKVNPPIHVI